jgi:hypothetical protein
MRELYAIIKRLSVEYSFVENTNLYVDQTNSCVGIWHGTFNWIECYRPIKATSATV